MAPRCCQCNGARAKCLSAYVVGTITPVRPAFLVKGAVVVILLLSSQLTVIATCPIQHHVAQEPLPWVLLLWFPLFLLARSVSLTLLILLGLLKMSCPRIYLPSILSFKLKSLHIFMCPGRRGIHGCVSSVLFRTSYLPLLTQIVGLSYLCYLDVSFTALLRELAPPPFMLFVLSKKSVGNG